MRRKIIAGNWKMNMTPSEAKALATTLAPLVKNPEVDVVYCVPFIDIFPVKEVIAGTAVHLGAENVYFEEKGAFTGETSPAMLKDAGVEYVIIGHSERREYFHETDEIINKKLLKLLEHQFKPILCCGESLAQREAGVTMDFIRMQLKLAFQGVSASDAAKVTIAYEPIWAIGTGKTATVAQAEEVCRGIRETVKELYGEKVAEEIRIQYGGSMNEKNCKELLAEPDIDGGLIGGASLKPEFGKIVNYKAL